MHQAMCCSLIVGAPAPSVRATSRERQMGALIAVLGDRAGPTPSGRGEGLPDAREAEIGIGTDEGDDGGAGAGEAGAEGAGGAGGIDQAGQLGVDGGSVGLVQAILA